MHDLRLGRDTSFALVTIVEGKFFSNSIDLAWTSKSYERKKLMNSKLKQIVADLFSLSMQTIAAVTGHALGPDWSLSSAMTMW